MDRTTMGTLLAQAKPRLRLSYRVGVSSDHVSSLMAPLEATTLRIPDLQPTELANRVRTEYELRLDRPGGGFYEADWKRVSYAEQRIRSGGTLLDVGSGAGHLSNMLALSGRFDRVVALDRIRNGLWQQLSDTLEEHRGDITSLPYPDDSFDVVVCMEVLEHLPDGAFAPGLAELRRVCRGQLLMTVPYREPEPLYATHLRRFEDEDLLATFPAAGFTILGGIKKPWVVMEERYDGTSPWGGVDVMLVQRELREVTGQLHLVTEQLRASKAALRRARDRRVVKLADALGRPIRRIRRRFR